MNFFKKLFSREPEDLTLKQIELEDWLQENSEDFLTESNKKIKKSFAEIDKIKSELLRKLSKLGEAELVNPDIPEREKHIMRGNRANYIQKTESFLEDIELPELDYEIINNFCTDFERQLKNFNQSTSKGYFVLTNFFDKEMKEIAMLIKHIEDSVIQLLNILKDKKTGQFKILSGKIRRLNELNVNKEKFAKNLIELENELENSEDRKIRLQQRVQSLKNSKDFNNFYKFEKQKQELNQEINDLNFKLNNSIKSLDKVLRKHMHSSLKKDLISHYLESPLQALDKDSKFEILKIFEKLKLEIKKGHMEVKEKQKDKILRQIEKITKAYLSKIRNKYEKLKDERTKINDKMEKLNIMMDYKELQYQAEHIHDKIIKLNDLITEKKDIILNLNISQKTKQLENALSDFSGNDIKIK